MDAEKTFTLSLKSQLGDHINHIVMNHIVMKQKTLHFTSLSFYF